MTSTATPSPDTICAGSGSAATDIHSCSYYCDRPACIQAQRDELRARVAELAQDAARYRWLRVDKTGDVYNGYSIPEELDARIDEEIKG
jgi:hypothetical protein